MSSLLRFFRRLSGKQYVRQIKAQFSLLTQSSFVGQDSAGNKFYEVEQPGGPPRRIVQYKNGVDTPGSLHIKWQSWLAGRRQNPPTQQEIYQDALRLADLKRRVAELEEEDAKLRVQEMASRGGLSADQASSAADVLSSMMKAIRREEADQQANTRGSTEGASSKPT